MYDGTNDILALTESLGRENSSRSHFDPELPNIVSEEPFRNDDENTRQLVPLYHRVSLSHPRPRNECANVRTWRLAPSGAEGFTRKCVGAVRPPSRSSFGPLRSGSCASFRKSGSLQLRNTVLARPGIAVAARN
jgi:hypothetical protein